ncbi:MAG TPA: hypothetical protein VN203_22920, partial [Candidatus Acidoferrum sp.]|nr:hypothetical protein [Candidatus Acidoferrum sp.]
MFTVSAAGAGLSSAPTVVTVIQDRTPPILLVVTPPNNALTNGVSIPVRGRVTDAITPVSVFVNDAVVSVDDMGGFATTIPLLEGPNEVHIRSIDAAGNAANETRTVIVDTAPPMIILTAPPEGAVVPGNTVTVSGTVSDLHPSTTVIVNGQPVPVATDGRFSREIAFPITQTAVVVSAIDLAGNTASMTRWVIRDAMPPAILITTPSAGFLTNHATITVSGTVTDASGIASVDVNGQPINPSGDAFTATVNLAEGANTVIVTAKDSAGNIGTASVSGTLDTRPPTVTVVSAPQDFSNSRTLTIGVTAADNVTPAGEIQFAFSLDNETVFGSYGSTATVTYDLAADGAHTIRVKARDQAGNESPPYLVTTRVDTVPPVLTLTTPAPGFLTNQAQMSVSGTVTDASGIMTVSVNGQPASLTGTGFTATVALVEGTNTLMVAAVDAAGNTSTASVTGTLDTVVPVVTVTTPVSGFVTNQGTVTVSGTVTDIGVIDGVTVNGRVVPLNG